MKSKKTKKEVLNIDVKLGPAFINPITQRCNTVSRKHHFEPLLESVPMTFGKEISYWTRHVEINGRKLYKCIVCELVDDLHEGKFD